MSESAQHIQLNVIAVLATLITIGSFVYILWKQPESLRVSRDGVPFFTPAVIHPDTGQPISIDELVNHFKAED